jgi:pimeloyl-ACP methyl ester carboxylesterase
VKDASKLPVDEPQTLIVGAGATARAIVYRRAQGRKPDSAGLFWLSGFMSDMNSTKAAAVAAWAADRGLASTRFDYSGHGVSGGAFTDGTIGRWLEEAEAVLTRATVGPQIVIGSSMGGHIALLLLRRLLRDAPGEAKRIRALVLIAPAWDMTEELMWKRFSADVRHEITDQGYFEQPSRYAAPYTITRQLIEDGRKHLLARQPFDPGRPVVIMQGLQDPDVPASHTRELTTFLTGGQVKLIEIPDGEHRLSRPQDLDVLFAEIAKLL